MTSWEWYWLTRLDSIKASGEFFFIFGLLAAVGFVLTLMAKHVGGEDVGSLPVWFGSFTIPFLIIAGILEIAVPTTKEFAVIVVAPRMEQAIRSNEKLTQVPDNILDLANAWIEELKPKTKAGK